GFHFVQSGLRGGRCAALALSTRGLALFSPALSALTRNDQSSRRNVVLDVDADAVPAERVRRVDRRNGQVGRQAGNREEADGEAGVSARERAPRQLADAAAIDHRRPEEWYVGYFDHAGEGGEGWVTPDDRAEVDEREEAARNSGVRGGEILNVDLGRV